MSKDQLMLDALFNIAEAVMNVRDISYEDRQGIYDSITLLKKHIADE